MKFKKLLALLLACAMLFALAACGESSTTTTDDSASSAETATDAADTSSDASTSDVKVGVFYYSYGDAFISSVRSALDEVLDEAGVNYQNYDGNSSQTTQNESIDTALAGGTNILVVNLVDTASMDAASAIIEKAASNNAQVIFFNRAVEGTEDEGAVLNAYDNVAFVGTDAPEAGHLQGAMIGEYLLEHYDEVDLNGDGEISYAMFMGQVGNVEAIYRTQYGVEDADALLTEAGKSALVYFDANNTDKYQADQAGNWSASAAMEYMQTNLSQYSEANGNMIELVICNNDNMAEGAISALQQAGYNNGEGTTTIPVFGVDATDSAKSLIASGYMTGTVEQSATGMANALLQMIQNVSSGSSMDDAVAAIAAGDAEMYTVSENVANKLYVAYAAYTG